MTLPWESGQGCRKKGVSVDHLIHGGLLVPRACHDVLVVPGDVTTEHRGGLLGLWTGGGGGGEAREEAVYTQSWMELKPRRWKL